MDASATITGAVMARKITAEEADPALSVAIAVMQDMICPATKHIMDARDAVGVFNGEQCVIVFAAALRDDEKKWANLQDQAERLDLTIYDPTETWRKINA